MEQSPTPKYVRPKSRKGKRQVIAYLSPHTISMIIEKSHKDGKTLQESLADAINQYLIHLGHPPLLSSGHDRFIRRKNKAAGIRKKEHSNCNVRVGKKAISGWYYKYQVEQLNEYVKEHNMTIQNIIEQSLEHDLKSDIG